MWQVMFLSHILNSILELSNCNFLSHMHLHFKAINNLISTIFKTHFKIKDLNILSITFTNSLHEFIELVSQRFPHFVRPSRKYP